MDNRGYPSAGRGDLAQARKTDSIPVSRTSITAGQSMFLVALRGGAADMLPIAGLGGPSEVATNVVTTRPRSF
jgi:hypothetical protein